jgi:uncharacterized protein YjiK
MKKSAFSRWVILPAAVCILLGWVFWSAQQGRVLERDWFALKQRINAFWHPEARGGISAYSVDIQALAVSGETDMSSLAFDAERHILLSVTNKNPHLVELSLDGKLLRRIPLSGFKDTESVEYLGPGEFMIAEERRQRLTKVRVAPDTTQIDIRDPAHRQFFLGGQDPGNKGFEGLAFDPQERRLYIAKENNPIRIFEVSGFFPDAGVPSNPQVHTDPRRDEELFLTDISGLAFDTAARRLLVLSDESKLAIELDAQGHPAATLDLRAGSNGLRKDIPQPEGIAMDADGNIYILSEPNLFYRYRRNPPRHAQ